MVLAHVTTPFSSFYLANLKSEIRGVFDVENRTRTKHYFPLVSFRLQVANDQGKLYNSLREMQDM